jgi:hypothetical protein
MPAILGRRKPGPGRCGFTSVETIPADVSIRPIPAGGNDAVRHRRVDDVTERPWSCIPTAGQCMVHRCPRNSRHAFECQDYQLID